MGWMTFHGNYLIMIYSLSFFVLWAVCRISRQSGALFLSLGTLGKSAFFFALAQLVKVVSPLFDPIWVSVIEEGFLLISLGFLYHFYVVSIEKLSGKRMMIPGIIFILVLMTGMIIGMSRDFLILSFMIKMSFEVLLSVLTLVFVIRKGKVYFKGSRFYSLAASFCLSLFYIFHGFDSVAVFSRLHRDLLLEWIGFPVAPVNAFLIFMFSFFLWRYYLSAQKSKDREEGVYQNRYAIRSAKLLFLLLTAGFAVHWIAVRYAQHELQSHGENYLNIFYSKIQSEFREIENSVQTLAGSPWISPLLEKQTPANLSKAEDVLKRYGAHVENTIYYIIDLKGRVITDNQGKGHPESLKDLNVFFRPYFQDAMKGKLGRYLAEGVLTGARGYYVCYPVRNSTKKILGAVAIKKNLAPLEMEVQQPELLFLVSPEKVIFISSLPQYLFRRIWESSASPLTQQTFFQFGAKDFSPVFQKDASRKGVLELSGNWYQVFKVPFPFSGWNLIYLSSLKWVSLYSLMAVFLSLVFCFLVIADFLQSQKILEEQRRVEISEKRFRILFQKAPEGILIVDAQSLEIQDFNEAVLHWLSYSRQELMGLKMENIEGGSIPFLGDYVRQITEKGLVFSGESRLKRKGGSRMTVELTAASFSFQNRDSLLFFIRDIEERIKDTERIRLTQKALEASSNGIVIADAKKEDFPLIYVNPAFIQMTGYEREEVLGKNCRFLQRHDRNQPGIKKIQEAFRLGLQVKTVLRNYTKSGELFWNEVSISPVRNEKGEITHYVGVQNNITERKRFEEQLEKALKKESSFRELLETLTDVLQMIANSRSGDELLGSICKKMVEYSRYPLVMIHQIQNGTVLEAYLGIGEGLKIEPELLNLKELFYQDSLIQEAFKKKETQRAFEQGLTGFWMSDFCTEIVSIPLKRDSSSEPLGIFTVFSSYSLGFEKEELDLLQELAMTIGFSLDSIQKEILLALQSRQAAMGEMIGNIAHQWKQPINTLNLIVQTMKIFKNMENQEIHRYLDEMIPEAQRMTKYMAQTIDDFRAFFIPDREKIRFNVRETILKTLALVQAGIQGKGIKIRHELEESLFVLGFPNEYSQVLLNLFNNAKDVLLQREIKDPEITLKLFQEGNLTVFSIQDNGGGIAEEIIPRIFSPYFTTKAEGTGIGLYMSRVIIEKHMEGKISFVNLPHGVIFRIELSSA